MEAGELAFESEAAPIVLVQQVSYQNLWSMEVDHVLWHHRTWGQDRRSPKYWLVCPFFHHNYLSAAVLQVVEQFSEDHSAPPLADLCIHIHYHHSPPPHCLRV